jgi:thioredoxin reductase (NADPH)
MAQVSRFRAEVVLANDVVGVESRGQAWAVLLSPGELEARALIVATGVSYQRLEVERIDTFSGREIYFGANASEADQCAGEDVYIAAPPNRPGRQP